MVAAFDMYWLLVENVFGSVFWAGIGLVIAYILIGILGRMSQLSIIWFVGLFIAVYSIGYGGTLVALIFFIAAMIYLGSGLIRVLMRWVT